MRCLSADLFAAGDTSGLRVDLMDMKVSELREELGARGETKTGCKPWLQRRLHAAIVRAHLTGSADEGVCEWITAVARCLPAARCTLGSISNLPFQTLGFRRHRRYLVTLPL